MQALMYIVYSAVFCSSLTYIMPNFIYLSKNVKILLDKFAEIIYNTHIVFNGKKIETSPFIFKKEIW